MNECGEDSDGRESIAKSIQFKIYARRRRRRLQSSLLLVMCPERRDLPEQ